MIEVHELTKRYGKNTAVDQLTFDVEPGHGTGFLGLIAKTTVQDLADRFGRLEAAYMYLTSGATEYRAQPARPTW